MLHAAVCTYSTDELESVKSDSSCSLVELVTTVEMNGKLSGFMFYGVKSGEEQIMFQFTKQGHTCNNYATTWFQGFMSIN